MQRLRILDLKVLLEMIAMGGLAPQTTEASGLQSNLRPCRRSELAMVASNVGVLKYTTILNFPRFCSGCVSGGISETLNERSTNEILAGYDTLLSGDAVVPVNQTHNFTFDVTEKTTFKVENIREDTDIKYDELNFLYQDIESIVFTVATRENKTYRLAASAFHSKNYSTQVCI